VIIGQKAENITKDIDFFIHSSAVPSDNPERQQVKKLGIPAYNYFQALGILLKSKKVIAVAGTNGKSTTTAMLAGCMIDAGLEPSVILGTLFSKIGGNYRYGKSDWFIVEACEYQAHFLELSPWAIVLTNIEEEHLDYFKDLDHILKTYQKFLDKLQSKNQILVINKDDININKLILPKVRIVSYGLHPQADLQMKNLRFFGIKQKFELVFQDRNLGEFILPVPGQFNLYNALATVAFCLTIDIPLGIIKQSLAQYVGNWRRFEIVKNKDITVISDYAHHPTSIQGTIESIKQLYPLRRLVVVFQPHQHDRTKKLFNGFSN